MTITTIDGAIAGMQPTRFFHKGVSPTLVVGRPFSTWGMAGIPGAGSFDTTLNGVTLSSTSALVNGQIPHTDPGSGNAYLARLVGAIANGGQLLLCDRLWHNGGFTAVTSAQSITSPTWPARDNSGATSGDGVLLGLEYNATGAANTPTITASYTNSAGTSGHSGTNAFATASGSAAGSFYPIGLQAGDLGVRSVQSVTFSVAPTAGTVNLVAYRVIASLECPLSYTATAIDILTSGMPQIFNGTVPFIVFTSNNATAGYLSGSYTETQG